MQALWDYRKVVVKPLSKRVAMLAWTGRGSRRKGLVMPDADFSKDFFFGLNNGAESAAARVDQRYRRKLCTLVEAELDKRFEQRESAEDVVQDVFGSYFKGIDQKAWRIDFSEGLWALLATIARRKILKCAEYNNAERCSPSRLQNCWLGHFDTPSEDESIMKTHSPQYQRGDRISGRYLVYQVLVGGMGEVYLCLDLERSLPLALKTFQARFLTNQRIREAFSEEVATWTALEKHPNIVHCFYMDVLENHTFMCLEWIAGDEHRGTDLRDWLRRGTLDVRETLTLAIHICRGLRHAGQKTPGIVHRDLKPENILVSQQHIAKITDFGLARTTRRAQCPIPCLEHEANGRKSLVSVGDVVGTPAYMAPEQ